MIGFIQPSPGIVLHPDQTVKQPVVWRCSNPHCIPIGEMWFDFESDRPRCPKCTSEGFPNVTKKALIHLMLRDAKGPIQGQYGRYRLACDKNRVDMATPTNGEAATDHFEAANCPGCLMAVGNKLIEDQGWHIHKEDKKEGDK